jgi:3-oxoacyl-[acyl-carrier protein] reductase
MHLSFEGRTALVTGAAQGIAQAIARALRNAGARVAVADIDAAGVQRFAAAEQLRSLVFDAADRSRAHEAVDHLLGEFGRLDILVNAAGGVCGQVGGPLEGVEPEAWQAIFRANLEGTLWLSQAACTPMRAAGYGRIVNIASGAGLKPSLTGIQAYTAAKHALVGLTRQLAQDLGPAGITCNAVAPGFVRSNPSSERQWERYGAEGQHRLVQSIYTRRLGHAEDIAYAALFLAHENAGWITGQVLSVDGGSR